MPQPKKGATKWSLNLRDIPISLYRDFHHKALDAGKGILEWAIDTLAKDATGKGIKEHRKKRAKTSPASHASNDQ
jgi:hypothetical protein